MTSDDRLVAVLTDWLDDQPERAPTPLLEMVLTDLRQAPQNARWKVALRRFPMFTSNGARYFAVAAVGVLAVVVGIGLWAGRGGGVGSTPTPNPTPTPTLAATLPGDVPSIGPRFTSSIHAISLSYPEGWVTRAATDPWTTNDLPYFGDNNVDVIYDPVFTDHMFILVSSQSHAGKTRQEWASSLAADEEGCEVELMPWDGGTAWISRTCRLFFLAESDVGWFIRLYASDLSPALEPEFNRLFEEILDTVQIHPASSGG